MRKPGRTPTGRSDTLTGRRYRAKRVDFLTRPYIQRLEDRRRGGRSGRADGRGENYATATGEQPAHAVIDRQRDRGLAEAAEAFAQPRANALRARDEAAAIQQNADRQRDRLAQQRAELHAVLYGLEAGDAA
jgi:hypothetical protein